MYSYVMKRQNGWRLKGVSGIIYNIMKMILITKWIFYIVINNIKLFFSILHINCRTNFYFINISKKQFQKVREHS